MIQRTRGLLLRIGRSKRFRIAIIIYALLLVASHVWTDTLAPTPTIDPAVQRVEIPAMTRDGALADGDTSIVGVRGWVPVFNADLTMDDMRTVTGVRTWSRDDTSEMPPLLLLHGSPSGGSDDFKELGPVLAKQTRRTVLAIDRLGYAASSKYVPNYSVRANARTALALLDALGIDRAHAVGWSQGSGAAIWMGELEPDRIASVSLIAGIGVQEGEGSGDYYFEHAKYALGYALLVALPEAIPHFGALGPRSLRHSFIRDFWDTDQRPIRGVLEDYPTPLLVIQGRNDPLVPATTAEEHEEITPGARLLMLDASHFFVFRQGEEAERTRAIVADEMARFVARHDAPGVDPVPGVVDLAPVMGEADPILGGFQIPEAHWLVIVIIIALATLVTEDLTVIGAGLLASTQQIDIGVALIGCFLGILAGDWGLVLIGRFAGRRVLRWRFFRKSIPERSLARWEKMFDRHLAKAVFISRMLPGTRLPMYVSAGILSKRLPEFMLWMTVAIAIWVPMLMALAIFVGTPVLSFFNEYFHGPVAVLFAFTVLFLLIRIASYEATYSGRHKLNADLRRLVSHEFWPPFIFYLPLVPKLVWLALTRGGPMTFTCADPGIQPAGGVVNEPKTDIVRALETGALAMERPELVLSAREAPPHDDPAQRAQMAIDLIETQESLGGFPVILKPEAAQRGFGIRVARTPEDVHAYFEQMTRAVQIQRYHPGPVEIGVFWMRVPTAGTPVDEWPSEIFSITRKEFPVITGDAQHTIEHLIWAHPRCRMQAKVFLRRFDERLDDVLPEGEEMPLALAGNHAQGTMFKDGADLITPELERTIDALARAYRNEETGDRIDFGRFDVRAASEDAIRRGEVSVIELNGVLSESTNLYDPDRSVFWAYRVLFRQWTRLYDIGAARRREGVKATGPLGILRLMRGYYAAKPPGITSD